MKIGIPECKWAQRIRTPYWRRDSQKIQYKETILYDKYNQTSNSIKSFSWIHGSKILICSYTRPYRISGISSVRWRNTVFSTFTGIPTIPSTYIGMLASEENIGWFMIYGVLTPLSRIFQLYRDGHFYCWRKPEYPEKSIDLSLTYLIKRILEANIFYILD